MAKKEGYVVDLNKLYRYDDTTGNFVIPKTLWANGKEYYAAFSNGSLCYNKALYELYLEDTELVALASGVIMDPYVYVSIKTDFDGTETEVKVTDTLEDIEPNYSLTEERTGTFSVTQATSNFVLTGTYRQRKDSYNEEYYDLKITDVVCPLIPASGGSRPLTVYYSCMSIRRYESGKEETKEINESTTSFTDVDVEVASGASFDYSTGKLSGSNLGYNVTAESTIATVTYVSISAYGLADDWSGSQSWKQEANSREKYGELQYNVSIRVDGSEEVLPGTTYAMLVASATKTQYYIYTAKPDDLFPETSPATGTITASSGATVSPASITGSGQSVKLSFPANSDEETKVYTATIAAGGKTASASVEQQTAKEEYYWEAPVATGLTFGEIPASGAAISIYVNYTQRYMKKVGSITTVSKDYNEKVVATTLSGSKANNTSTAVVSGGTIGADNLGTTLKTTTTPQFNITGGTYKAADGETYPFSLTGSVVQAVNILNPVSERDIYSVTDPEDMLSSDTVLYLVYQARHQKVEQWSSDTNGSYRVTTYSDISMKIAVSGSYTGEQTVSGSGTATFTVGANDSTASVRTFTVNAYDSNGNSVISAFTVEQAKVQAAEYYWEAPVATGLTFGEIPASGKAISIYVNFTQRYMKKVGSVTTVSETYNESVVATTLSGSKANNSSTAVVSGGTIGADSLGTTLKTTTTPQFNITGGTYKAADGETYPFSLTGSVVQAVNILNPVSERDIYNVTDPEDMLSGDSTLYIAYQAQHEKVEQWSSDTNGSYRVTAYSDLSLRIVVGVGYTGEKTVSGKGTATFPVGTNSSTTSSRTFRVMAYDSSNNVVANFNVVQAANILSWLAPTINGTWSVSNISAAGGSTTVRVPIVQLQVNTSGTEVDRYTGWADAISIGGTASNGGSVSGGTISAPSLGQTATSERTVFTITSVKVKSGGDGKEYTISVSPSVAVKQNANYQWVERSRYNVSITPQGNIPALGGSAALLVNAYEWVYYYWASAPNTPTNETGFSMTGYVTAASGTISGSPIVGTGKQVTLAYNTENFGAARSITVSLRAVSGVGLPDINISKEVTQSAASYVLTAGSDKECNATASTVYVTFTSSRNGKAWEPAFTTNNADATINNSGITLSGTTYTVPVAIQANSSSSNRDIIVTATQSRYSGDVTATVTITQAGAAQNLPLAGVVLNECMYTSDALTSVSYSLYFTASPSSSYQGGTLSNVVVQLNTAANGSGSVLASRTIGNVTVSRGSNSSTYSGTLSSGGRVAYLLVYWGGSIQFATEVEEYVPEG